MVKIQKMDFLIALYIFCIAVAELMGGKTFQMIQFSSFQLNASVAIFVVPLIFSINDVITEVHGAVRMRSIIRSGLFVIFLILLFSLLATNLPPSSKFTTQEKSYDAIFGLSARIAAASLTAFAIADFLDVFLFSKIRQKLGKKRLWLRNNASNVISQFIDTVVFMFLAFYSFKRGFFDNTAFLFSLILPYWILKCVMSVIETPFVYLGVRWLRNTEEESPKNHLIKRVR